MRFAISDQPYLGRCRLYRHHHPAGPRPFDGRCWDEPETHRLLMAWLEAEFPDGWAMCASEPSLRTLLPMTPEGTRTASWTKTFCAFKKNVRPAHAWEPVFFRSRANPPETPHAPPRKGAKQTTPKDFLAAPIAMRKGFPGAKPPEFTRWVLSLLNVRHGDAVVDIFHGSGAVADVLARREHDLFA